ncbi:hypothetical protein I79_019219 [Cricetulus griseus]|uniref:Uncharacterized protein n=1 Tax=Cricetulus griseus TaxID=10029 RepID=G3I6U1_CRIGR|nr:hypothetical protein I79_019219 [Cricetulus griseus]
MSWASPLLDEPCPAFSTPRPQGTFLRACSTSRFSMTRLWYCERSVRISCCILASRAWEAR